MGICSLENCGNECYEQEDKCILHCKKNEKNGWYTFDTNNKKVWDLEKVKLFWEKVTDTISSITQNESEYKDVSQGMKDEHNHEQNKYEFAKVIFPASVFDDIEYKSFFGLDKDINIKFDKCIFLDSNDFSLISKAKNVTFNNCYFFEDIEFKQMEFNGLFLFENCKVCKDIKFQNIIFKKITSLIKSKFHQELNFIHSRFDDLALFNEIKVEKLLLDNTFFRVEANFLDINANVANRETARIIKNSFEKQNNIIEANKFYKLEMKKREEELDIKKGENILDWLVFKIHSISSDHSQSWLLALIWILYFTFMFSFLKDFYDKDNAILSDTVALLYFEISLIIVLLIDSIKIKFKYIVGMITIVISYLIYGISSCDFALKCFSSNINPFGKLGTDITLDMLIFKIIIAYLIYQFIVSVRQNTRRS